MKKLIIILLMLAGTAHAHIVRKGEGQLICAEMLSMAVKSMTEADRARSAAVMWVNERSARVKGDEWATEVGKALAAHSNVMFWKVSYISRGCSVIYWNRTMSDLFQINEGEIAFIEAFSLP